MLVNERAWCNKNCMLGSWNGSNENEWIFNKKMIFPNYFIENVYGLNPYNPKPTFFGYVNIDTWA